MWQDVGRYQLCLFHYCLGSYGQAIRSYAEFVAASAVASAVSRAACSPQNFRPTLTDIRQHLFFVCM